MAYGDFKSLPRRTTSDKLSRGKVFNITKNPKYNGYQRRIASMVYEFLVKNLLMLILQVVLLKVKLCQTND